MRFQILLLKGGIYLDWDVIVLKPFTELLNSGHPMLMGEEKRVPGYQYAISNAVMMARPRSRFISQVEYRQVVVKLFCFIYHVKTYVKLFHVCSGSSAGSEPE